MKTQKSKFLEALEVESAKTQTANGAEAYATTTNNNLDLFAVGSREIDIVPLVKSAWAENRELALANIIYTLDIRNGKGERKHFLDAMLALKEIGVKFTDEGNITLTKLIVALGRADYAIKLAFAGILDKEIVYLYMYERLFDNALIAKWMPSINTSSKITRSIAKDIIKTLELKDEKSYRTTLSSARKPLNLVESALSQKKYNKINYSQVPTKAMLKYREAFKRHDAEKYAKFFEDLKKGVEGVKINTAGLFVYEIIEKVQNRTIEVDLAEQMWKNQKDFIPEEFKDVKAMVVADTSWSMSGRPMATSIGLAMYFAERNSGIFKDHFITFSSIARLIKIKGKNIIERYNSFPSIVENTNIQSVYDLVLKTAVDNNLNQSDLPEYLIFVTDMQFDEAQDGRINFDSARLKFKNAGYKLPKIIFWNVCQFGNQTFEVMANDKNVAIVGGFATAIFKNLFTLDKLTPNSQMLDTLNNYLKLFTLSKIIK